MIELFGILLTCFLILIIIKCVGIITWTGVILIMLIIILLIMFIAAAKDTY